MRATVAGAGAIGLWAFLALLSRAASAVPPLELTALALGVSGALGLALLAVLGRTGELRQPAVVWAHGVGGLFLYHALYFAAFARAPAATVNLINYLWPLLIVLLKVKVPASDEICDTEPSVMAPAHELVPLILRSAPSLLMPPPFNASASEPTATVVP